MTGEQYLQRFFSSLLAVHYSLHFFVHYAVTSSMEINTLMRFSNYGWQLSDIGFKLAASPLNTTGDQTTQTRTRAQDPAETTAKAMIPAVTDSVTLSDKALALMRDQKTNAARSSTATAPDTEASETRAGAENTAATTDTAFGLTSEQSAAASISAAIDQTLQRVIYDIANEPSTTTLPSAQQASMPTEPDATIGKTATAEETGNTARSATPATRAALTAYNTIATPSVTPVVDRVA